MLATRPFGIIVAAWGLALQSTGWRTVVLRGEGNTDLTETCRWDPEAADLRRSPLGLQVDCGALRGTIVRCDAPGREPRDYRDADLCDAKPLLAAPLANLVSIAAPPSSRLSLQWLRWNDGAAPEVVASRAVVSSGVVHVPVADSTFLRMQVDGQSPRTAMGRTLAASPMPFEASNSAGGEIAARLGRVVVAPSAVEIVGPLTRMLPLPVEGWFSESGLVPGRYTLRRVYRGGAKSTPLPADVEAGRSTSLWLAADRVGALRLSADPSYCARGEFAWELASVETEKLVDRLVSSGTSTACSVTLDGLTPATYAFKRVVTAGDDLPIRRTLVPVRSQQVTETRIEAPRVVVRGLATLAGRPLANREITFRRPGRVHHVTTGSDGFYAAVLDVEGTYSVSMSGTPGVTRPSIASLAVGENQFNVDLQGGRLSVDLRGALSDHLNVHLIGPHSIRNFRVDRPAEPWQVDGLEYGQYGVWVSGENSASERYQIVTLNAGHPEASVSTTLVNRPILFTVLDGEGRPATDAALFVGSLKRPLRLDASGTAQVTVTPGSTLVVRTETGSGCLIVDVSSAQTVVVPEADREQDLLFNSPGDIRGAIEGLGSAACRLDLAQLSYSVSRQASQYRVSVRLPAGEWRLVVGDRIYALHTPGPAVTIK